MAELLVPLAALAGGVLCLTGGAEALLRGSVRIARRFGLSDLVIGATLVAAGTSAPELFVSLAAARAGRSEMAMGNVVGSNVCNVLLVLGSAALCVPFLVDRKSHPPQAWFNLAVTALLLGMVAWDGGLDRLEGAVLLGLLCLYVWRNVARRDRAVVPEPSPGGGGPGAAAALSIAGLALLWGGSELTLFGAVSLARRLGLEERVIALSLVALGTSLPELATSVLAALRRNPDIALGNVLGSNVFNLLCILGASALVRPLALGPAAPVDLLAVAGAGLFLLGPVLFGARIGRRWGLGALLLYAGYIYWLFSTGRT